MNRKIFLTATLACALFFGLSAEAPSAATSTYWYACTVQQAGPSSGLTIFYLASSPTSSAPGKFAGPMWFRASGADATKMLATALTAKSLGAKVEIGVQTNLSTVKSNSTVEIKTMLLLNE